MEVYKDKELREIDTLSKGMDCCKEAIHFLNHIRGRCVPIDEEFMYKAGECDEHYDYLIYATERLEEEIRSLFIRKSQKHIYGKEEKEVRHG